MKIKYENKSEFERREEEKQQKLSAKEEAQRILDLVDKAPDELFPEFLWKPIINEFSADDGYLLKGSTEIQAVKDIFNKGLHRKYNDYWDYLDALEAYIEYAHYIEDTYGSFEMMRRAAQEGMSTVYIPKVPQLSNKKMNKAYLSSGFMPSRVDEKYEEDPDVFRRLSEDIPLAPIDNEQKTPKYMRKLREEAAADRIKKERQSSIFSVSSSREYVQASDAIINFLTNRETKYNGGEEDYESMSEAIDELHEFDYIPDDVVEEMIMPKKTYVENGRMVGGKEHEQLLLVEELESNGWDFFSTMLTKGMNKEAIRAISSRLGKIDLSDEDLAKLSKKDRKKLKKVQKQMDKAAKIKILGDRRLQAALTRNRVHLAMEDQNFLNFRLSDVIPDDDE